MIRRCIFLFVLVSLISCGGKDKIPVGILKPDKMQAVLWDIINADAFTKTILLFRTQFVWISSAS